MVVTLNASLCNKVGAVLYKAMSVSLNVFEIVDCCCSCYCCDCCCSVAVVVALQQSDGSDRHKMSADDVFGEDLASRLFVDESFEIHEFLKTSGRFISSYPMSTLWLYSIVQNLFEVHRMSAGSPTECRIRCWTKWVHTMTS
jgi:hypothetical protein